MGRGGGGEMQNEWDLGMKTACLAYNNTVFSSAGQAPFFATFGLEMIVFLYWIYQILKADSDSELSDWTETIQERFQTAYAGTMEKQQEAVRCNAQYYKPLMNQFELGQWVWLFGPRIIPKSCDKLRSYWAGHYKIVRLLAPALAQFRGENNKHGFPSDPPPSLQGE